MTAIVRERWLDPYLSPKNPRRGSLLKQEALIALYGKYGNKFSCFSYVGAPSAVSCSGMFWNTNSSYEGAYFQLWKILGLFVYNCPKSSLCMKLLSTKHLDVVCVINWVPRPAPGYGASHQPEGSGLDVCWADQEDSGPVLCWKGASQLRVKLKQTAGPLWIEVWVPRCT